MRGSSNVSLGGSRSSSAGDAGGDEGGVRGLPRVGLELAQLSAGAGRLSVQEDGAEDRHDRAGATSSGAVYSPIQQSGAERRGRMLSTAALLGSEHGDVEV